ncbi:MAG: patatin-like phospholipase family protein [Syntrophomonadaceae bacterium]|nr:patatin-like phospholipase family protein [Syntrophomonadaceae bacterium]MDD3022674.1 patatin-like phospholipase family protein [Syntrophomonadaceae bacterium]
MREKQLNRPRIGLVLGAGSARGLAHIGVLQVLNENNIPFDFIVGSSMGAMIGGIYAAGADINMLDRMIEHMDTSLLFDIHVPRMGFIGGKKIASFLSLMTKKKTFSELDFPLLAMATDLLTGQRVIMEEGLVADAIRASISIPGVFSPVKRDGMILVDGAVSDRLPIEVARSRGADLVIAVDVTFSQGKQISINNALDVILTSLDIMGKQQFDLVYPQSDILIQPRVSAYSPRSFEKSREIVDLGREAAKAKIEDIRDKISNFNLS